ncbi:hypothetical protein [Planococcus chinensis]|uniref:Uncharacterized protein n=1 Tax=Planococcus chinensis TaxID=272917 RepID=A0ABW4QEM7_9BACL
MEPEIVKVLKAKGIDVPAHHVDMLVNQWAVFEKMRETVKQEALADYDIGLTHVPGGDRK